MYSLRCRVNFNMEMMSPWKRSNQSEILFITFPPAHQSTGDELLVHLSVSETRYSLEPETPF